VIGGITGSDIVRYDIYGTDVMISNKMESNGEPGKIMVSETTKNLLESAYESEYTFTKGAKVQDII
jgi:class 3 adenylate cyclase